MYIMDMKERFLKWINGKDLFASHDIRETGCEAETLEERLSKDNIVDFLSFFILAPIVYLVKYVYSRLH
jgi:hypothetical protein